MLRYFLFFLSFITLSVFAQKKPTFKLQGTIDTTENAVYYFSYEKQDSLITDTVILGKSGSFQLEGTIDEPSRLFIAIEDKYDPRIVGPFYVYQAWLEPDRDMLFKGHKGWQKGMDNYTLSNSFTDSLANKFIAMANQDKKGTDPRLAFLEMYPDTYYGLFVLYGMLSKEHHLEEIATILPHFAQNFSNSQLYQKVNAMLKTKIGLQSGATFPDFQMEDTAGEMLNLKDINKGKYVLVDFWASWCGPCRKESPYLTDAYKRYHIEGFDIISVSLDDNKEDWLKAIAQDGMLWHNVSDLQGFNNRLAKSLSIHSIPDNFLLDPTGKIIGRNLKGDALLNILKELY